MSLQNDAYTRLETILKVILVCSAGSASDCRGMEVVRRQVAHFIRERDGVPGDYKDVFLSSGATDALRV